MEKKRKKTGAQRQDQLQAHNPVKKNKAVNMTYHYYTYINPDGGFTGLDLGRERVISKIRFMPVLTSAYLMEGGKFQGAKNNTEEDFEDIYTIRKPFIGWNVVVIDHPRAYRYVRYVGPPGSHCMVSAIEYYTSKSNPDDSGKGESNDIKLAGTPFGAGPSLHPGQEYDQVYKKETEVTLTFASFAKKTGYPFYFDFNSRGAAFYHRHDFIELIYIKHGSCFHHCQGKILSLFAGDFLVIPPGTVHYYFALVNLSLFNILIYPQEIPVKIRRELSELDGFQFFFSKNPRFQIADKVFDKVHTHIEQQKKILPLLNALETNFRNEPAGWRNSCYGLFMLLMVNLSLCFHGDHFAGSQKKRRYNLVADVMSYLENNYTSITNLDEILGKLKISYSRLAHIFNEETGSSVYDFLNRTRIGHACRMLMENHGEITEIAYNVGFKSYNNFIRAFKRLVGCSPLEFRNKNKAE
ncbi:MAG: AraC family transcriptional regulator [Bacillota bacterium]